MIDSSTDFYSFKSGIQVKPYKELMIGEKYSTDAFLTVIITTYNRLVLLQEAIESALNQRGDLKYNILVVDNCASCYLSNYMLDKYRKKNIRIVRNEENLGMFGNMNQGAALAKTKYICFLHDDDLYCPEFVESVASILNLKSWIKALHVGVACKQKDGSLHNYILSNHLSANKSKDYSLIFRGPGAPTGLIVDREAFIYYGGYNTDYYPTSDYCFACLFAHYENYYKCAKTLCVYRLEDNASLREETLTSFVYNDCFLHDFIMKQYNIPKFIRAKILGFLVDDQEKMLREKYNSHFSFRLRNTLDIDKGVFKFSYLVLRFFIEVYFRVFSFLHQR